eukprot:TRINITY_DN12359_c0_g1_i1.p1 TRINITY_DN12359_c0_g1~~TRINITY_DN12359_c0_g1_i1.p1  ORF type:complete len:231 (+),score=27.69 TRINITY_DN12359_c0_g1_i1:133-825(+)
MSTVFSPAELLEYRHLFDLLDTQKQGTVSTKEVESLFRRLGHPISAVIIESAARVARASSEPDPSAITSPHATPAVESSSASSTSSSGSPSSTTSGCSQQSQGGLQSDGCGGGSLLTFDDFVRIFARRIPRPPVSSSSNDIGKVIDFRAPQPSAPPGEVPLHEAALAWQPFCGPRVPAGCIAEKDLRGLLTTEVFGSDMLAADEARELLQAVGANAAVDISRFVSPFDVE